MKKLLLLGVLLAGASGAAHAQTLNAAVTSSCGTQSFPTSGFSPIVQITTGSVCVFVANTNANGSATSANSSPVVIASDQAAVATKAASGAFVAGSIADLAHGQGTMAASVPVAVASDQSALNVKGGAASGAALSGNPVLVAGGNGTNAYTLLTGTDGRLSLNTAQVNAVTVLTGTGAVGTGAQRIAVGTDSATIAGSAPTTVLLAQPQAGTAGGALNAHYYSAASNNATNVKASAGTLYSITVTQSTTTAVELKLYNLSASPTCSSATGIIDNIPIPSNVISPGYHLTYPVGRAFGTGIGFCLVAFGAPAADTDNGSAVTGVTVSFTYD